MRFSPVFVLLWTFVLLLSGCGAPQQRSGVDDRELRRNQQLAAELTQQAAVLIQSNPEEAMRLLRRAVEADLFHGPAHNNIGVILLVRGELYEAAEEFDWARRLMPGHPDPRINLGLALERGGKVEDALDSYASAVEVYPGHLPAIQALAQLQIRTGKRDEWTEELLNEIAYRGNETWKSWAASQLMKR